MSATVVREKRQVTLPQEVCRAAGLDVDDQVDWRFEAGEIRGRKLVPQPEPKRVLGKLARRGDALFLQMPRGYKLAPDAIEQAVAEERDSRRCGSRLGPLTVSTRPLPAIHFTRQSREQR